MGHGRRPWNREVPLAGDASYRRYFRVEPADGGTAVLVRYPPDRLDAFTRDLEVRAWLAERGLRVPGLLWTDPRRGEALLEDFGDRDAEAGLAGLAPARRLERALRLVEPLEILAGLDPSALPPWNEPLHRERLLGELLGFARWFAAGFAGRGLSPGSRAWLGELAGRVAGHPPRVCHRDYHLNNIHFLPGGVVGVIDFQDILVGPDTYDAVSLLRDRAAPDLLGEEDREAWLRDWAGRTGAAPGWEARVVEVEVQRGLKVLGTFARLCSSGARRYLRWMGPLAARLAPLAEELGAPGELVRLLLDWGPDGGDHVR